MVSLGIFQPVLASEFPLVFQKELADVGTIGRLVVVAQ
jgi:hypothetical protein